METCEESGPGSHGLGFWVHFQIVGPTSWVVNDFNNEVRPVREVQNNLIASSIFSWVEYLISRNEPQLNN